MRHKAIITLPNRHRYSGWPTEKMKEILRYGQNPVLTSDLATCTVLCGKVVLEQVVLYLRLERQLFVGRLGFLSFSVTKESVLETDIETADQFLKRFGWRQLSK